MSRFFFITFFFLLILSFNLFAQSIDNNEYDSLLTVWLNKNEADSNRLQAVHSIIWGRELFRNLDTTIILANQQLEMARKSGNKKFESKALNTKGAVCRSQGELLDALEFYNQALEIRLQTGDKRGAANTINNIGIIYNDQGQYAEAVENYTKSLLIHEELQNDVGIANALSNIGCVHHVNMKYDQALDYYTKALEVRKRTDDKRGMAIAYSNIGMIHKEVETYAKAMEFFLQASKIQEEILDDLNLAITLNHMAGVHFSTGELQETIELQERSIAICEKYDIRNSLIGGWCRLSRVYKARKEYSKSIELAEKAYKLAEEKNLAHYIQVASKLLFEIYKELGQPDKALNYYLNYRTVRDSLVNIETSKKILSQEFKYEYEKKQAIADAERDKQIASAYEKEQKQRVISFGIVLGLILVIIFTIIILRRLKITRQQNKIISRQNIDIKDRSEKILRMEKEQHGMELAQKQRDLEMVNANNLVKLTVRKNLINDLDTLTRKPNPVAELRTLLAELKIQTSSEEKIQTMHDNMDKVDSNFLEILSQKFPKLSKTEREVCAYIKLNLTIKEICALKKASVNSISVVRSRIRSKLNILREASLESFIQNV